MSNKNIVLALLILIWYVVMFGFCVPFLISAPSDIASILGAGLAIVHVMVPILWFNREKKEDIKKDVV